MRNYIDQLEAAYMTSRRQGDMMRDPEQERSSHQDRRNRYIDYDMEPETERYAGSTRSHRQTMDNQTMNIRSRETMEPSHRGKGPKNYKRSDERIKELVCDALCENPELDASNIDVEVKDCEVTLTGEVEEKYAKRLGNVVGVADVSNRIRIAPRQMG